MINILTFYDFALQNKKPLKLEILVKCQGLGGLSYRMTLLGMFLSITKFDLTGPYISISI